MDTIGNNEASKITDCFNVIDPKVVDIVNEILVEVKQIRADLNKPKLPWGGPG
jgi:hypothetical protein